MKSTWFLLALGLSFSACTQVENNAQAIAPDVDIPESPEIVDTVLKQKIQVALLLDTSNSMDGLIEQAKIRLWSVVNTLTTLKFQGQEPDIEIALYQYGNDGLSAKEDWVKLVVPLTKDLDEISEKLFALRTNGGTEYCGSVINHAVKNLLWDDQPNSLKLVYIAGNEEFNQHGFNYKEAVKGAVAKDIFVNTIYCGSYETGVSELWRDGATLGKGKYFNIDADRTIQFVATPYDDSIAYHNVKLNGTYMSYSISGNVNKSKQIQQDASNQALSEGAYIERSISKSKANAYDNSHWDLADKYKKDPKSIEKIKQEELPDNLKNKSTLELETEAKRLLSDREQHQKAIQSLSVERQKYLDNRSKNQKQGGDDLGQAMQKSIIELAKAKGYSADN